MKVRFASLGPSRAAYALLLALVFIGVSLLILTSLLQWTSGNTLLTDRNNAYNRAVAAAEAATEMVLSHMSHDFVNTSYNPANLGVYRSLVPTNDWATEYEFSNGAGVANQTWVDSTPTRVLTNLDSQFTGLYGLVYVCNTRANVKLLSTTHLDLAAAVRQDFQLASIPIFQFAIYYSMDLEINPYSARKVTGKVHGNANIYASPGDVLEFVDAVSAVGRIYHNRHPNDPNTSSVFVPIYDGLHQEKVSSLTLPIGTHNSPAAVQAILDPPPAGEAPASAMGKQRFYNKADLVVTTTATDLTVKFNVDGKGNLFTTVPNTNLMTGAAYTFLDTNASFFDYREGKQVVSTEIDVGKFNAWMTNNSFAALLTFARGRALNSIYVDDQRPGSAGKLTAVRVTNGRTLPSNGLTIATARPLYVKGNFNAPDLTAGSTNTSGTLPASLVGDSVTILSANWDDGYASNTSLNHRDAKYDTTINAALLAGIVQSAKVGVTRYYSGGVENFPRFLEDWAGHTLTYNGSMVVMFPSRYATNFWISPGTYYREPTRKWAFDVNFLNWNKLPPGTPQVQKLVRGQWKVIAATSPN